MEFDTCYYCKFLVLQVVIRELGFRVIIRVLSATLAKINFPRMVLNSDKKKKKIQGSIYYLKFFARKIPIPHHDNARDSRKLFECRLIEISV